jgi:hypothetical protein
MNKKLFGLLLVLLLCFFQGLEARKIVFVLDDSGSMEGDKFRAAVYGIQLTLASMAKEDELYLVKNYRAQRLNRNQSALTQVEKLSASGRGDFGLLKPVIEDIPFTEGEDIVIIIIGDGMWGDNLRDISTSSKDISKWDTFYSKYKPHLYALSFQSPSIPHDGQTSLYSMVLQKYPKAEYKDISVNSFEEIRKQLEEVIKRTLKAATVDDIKTTGSRTIEVTNKLPLKEIIVLVQKKGQPGSVPKVQNAEAEGVDLDAVFSVSNAKSKQNGTVTLSGHVAHLQPKDSKVIAAGTTIKITFDKEINPAEVALLPVADLDIPLALGGIHVISSNKTNNVYAICDNENTIDISPDAFIDGNGNEVDVESLKNCKISYSSDAGSGVLKYTNGKFQAKLNMKNKAQVILSLRLECEEIADITTPNYTIMRQKCDNPEPPIDLGRQVIQTPLLLSDLLSNSFDGCIKIYPIIYQDGKEVQVTTKNRKLIVNNLPGSFETAVTDKGDHWLLCLRAKKNCACFMTDDKIELELYMKSVTMNEKSLKRTLEIPLNQNISLWERCKWFLLALLLGILTLWYVLALLRKKRFKSESYITSKTVNIQLQTEKQVKYGSAQELPTNWFNRWLVPYFPERRHYDILFLEATDDKNTVLIQKKCLNKDKMRKNNQKLDHFTDLEDGVDSKGELVSHDDVITYDKGNGRKIYYKFNIPS